jgi:hypothetical protein
MTDINPTSPLAALTGAGRTDVLPGYTLSPWTLRDYGEMESEFARNYLATVCNAAASAPPEFAQAMISRALEDVKIGEFQWGRAAFKLNVFAATYVPLMLYLSLRTRHPEITREKAAALLTDGNRNMVHRAILENERFYVAKKKDDAAPTTTGQPLGPQSSNDAAGEDSATEKSAA